MDETTSVFGPSEAIKEYSIVIKTPGRVSLPELLLFALDP